MEIKIESPAFKEGEMIPPQFTCDGENISPPLKWSSIPEGTKSLAIIIDDPSAPGGTFVHWVVYNIPADVRELPADVRLNKNIPGRAVEGTNHFGEEDYGGPCPPKGVHTYFFRIYAADTTFQLKAGAGKKALMEAMEGHILAEGYLTGKYERKNI
jgi:Raf kinase inhibitor-like YbhB/YbcL family protein